VLILVPWKPVVFVWLLLSAMGLFWGAAAFVIDGKDAFKTERHHFSTAANRAPDRSVSHRKRVNNRTSANDQRQDGTCKVSSPPERPIEN
jgi:hypothetical protein